MRLCGQHLTVTFFEKALKRSGSKGSLISENSSKTTPALPAAMVMSSFERISLLGEGKHKLPKGSLTFTDGSQFDISKYSFSELRGNDI